ncbi:MAG TPA: hypothetical protein VHM48_12585 [Candidatus Limnocylindrales bacterium]|nr:hypothetical protein [Candidatus Limnocylindrales bacterium]
MTALGVWVIAEGEFMNSMLEAVPAELSEHYREIFRITRLSDYVTLEDDQAVEPVPVHAGVEEGAQDHG